MPSLPSHPHRPLCPRASSWIAVHGNSQEAWCSGRLWALSADGPCTRGWAGLCWAVPPALSGLQVRCRRSRPDAWQALTRGGVCAGEGRGTAGGVEDRVRATFSTRVTVSRCDSVLGSLRLLSVSSRSPSSLSRSPVGRLGIILRELLCKGDTGCLNYILVISF